MTRDDRAKTRRFRIWIDGRLSQGFAGGLDGMDQLDGPHGTVLVGDFRDDSHLQGVLDQLRRLAIGVQRFEIDPAPKPARTKEEV